MSLPDPETRLRGLRRRILALMLRAPALLVAPISVPELPMEELLGTRRLGLDWPVTIRAYVADPATHQAFSPAPVTPWEPAQLTAPDIEELVSVANMLRVLKTRLRVRYGDGGEAQLVPEPWGEWCHEFQATDASQVDAATPADYPLDAPATLRFAGVLYWYTSSDGASISLRVYYGSAGYVSNGRWVMWDGIGIHLETDGISARGGATLYLPDTPLRVTEDTAYALLRTPFAYVKVTYPSQRLCGG